MGMDVYGIAPASEAGTYFRNTVWSWRPLATFLCERYPEETAGCSYWQSNDADGLDADASRKLAERLRADLTSGYVGQYEKEYAARLDALADEQCRYCGTTGRREGQRCNVCRGKGQVRPSETWYPFSEENVREFAEFLEGCGGFEIC